MARRLDFARRKVPVHKDLVALCTAFVLAGSASHAASPVPRLLCYPVMPGDTVTALSVRLTRDPHGWRNDGFQILDPAAARFIPKADYRQIHPGLQACVVERMVAHSAARGRDWWLLALLCSGAAAAFFALQSSMDRRKSTALALRTFGAAFIREFERPLIDERSAQPALRSDLTLLPDGCSIEVLLAPTDRTRYPNLADHRTNVEYDVKRVLSVLNDRRFVCGPLRARGSWVAIPFRLKPEARKEGGA